MIACLIRWSIHNRFLVLLATVLVTAWGVYSVTQTPLDALPDLSIRRSSSKHRTRAKHRRSSRTGDLSAHDDAAWCAWCENHPRVFVVRRCVRICAFDDKTDQYWARSRVLEYLNQVRAACRKARPFRLPGCNRCGLGVRICTRRQNRATRPWTTSSMNDWFLKFELKSVPDVSEVASIGGMVRQYQVVLDPDKLRATASRKWRWPTRSARRTRNQVGRSLRWPSRSTWSFVWLPAYARRFPQRRIAHERCSTAGSARRRSPDSNRTRDATGYRELNGQGEVAGGVIVMRSGKNALATIDAVKAKLADLKRSLPAGVEVVTTYDRSQLIERAVDNLKDKLIEEFIIVGLVCAVFLFHLRSAFVAILSLPLGVLAAFVVMRYQG